MKFTEAQRKEFVDKFTYKAGDGIRMETRNGLWINILAWMERQAIKSTPDIPKERPEIGIDLWVKTGHGQGPEFMFKVQAVPRSGDEIWITLPKDNRVTRKVGSVIHDIENNRVIVFTP